ncbi:MAG: hypothetical protein LBQ55_00245 [Treponema sp.]|jgi:hypothetical protein|nr:hypothetical protein [Treponema sp.]
MALLIMAGCASQSPQTQQPSAPAYSEQPRQETESNTGVAALDTKIIDWENRNLQLPARPKWLFDLAQGNDGTVKEQFNMDDLGSDAVIKLIVVESASLDTARARALTGLAAKLSTELRTTVNMETAESLSDDQAAVTQTIAMKANFDVSGMRQVTDFWQQVETENAGGRKTKQYVFYRVYATGRASWQTMVRAYMNSVLNELMKDQSNQNAAQKIAQQFQQIADASAKNEAWNRDEIEYQRRVAEEARQDVNTARDQQHERGMQSDRLEVDKIAASRQQVIQASVSGGDIDWISALGTAAKIIF